MLQRTHRTKEVYVKRLFLALAFISGLSGLTGLGLAPASAQIYVRVGPPPAPRREYEPPRPHPGYVWIGGHWAWRGRWVWTGGYWSGRRRGCGWVPGHWVRTWRGYSWRDGFWRC